MLDASFICQFIRLVSDTTCQFTVGTVIKDILFSLPYSLITRSSNQPRSEFSTNDSGQKDGTDVHYADRRNIPTDFHFKQFFCDKYLMKNEGI
jgi:hypothetical protein